MPWCPKCKNEYRAGIAICPDCNESLVEELTEEMALFIPVFETPDEELEKKIVKYLIHCGYNANGDGVLIHTQEGEEYHTYQVFVSEDDYAEAVKAVRKEGMSAEQIVKAALSKLK